VISCTNVLDGEMSRDILKSMEGKPKKEQFKVFHYLFKRSYDLDSEEGIMRYKNFKNALKTIKEVNESGKKSYTLGITQFADLTFEEFKAKYTVNKKQFAKMMEEQHRFLNEEGYFDKYADAEDDVVPVNASTSYNWSSYLLTNRDQGQCGCCYTFAAAGAIEGAVAIKSGTKAYLSTQQLVDCDTSYPDSGCDGGLANYAFKYVKKTGLVLDSVYPFKSGTTQVNGSCQSSVVSSASNSKTKISSYNYCTNSQYEGETVKACTNAVWLSLLATGPVAVGMDASSDENFMYYTGGVWSPTADGVSCGDTDHAVIAIGWGASTTNSSQYVVTVRNSWGTSWGESGNFRTLYDPNNADSCGITGSAYKPVI